MAVGDKIRVLIVDDVSETRENVRKLLQFESDVDVVGAARTGKEAIQSSPLSAPGSCSVNPVPLSQEHRPVHLCLQSPRPHSGQAPRITTANWDALILAV